MTKIKSIKRKGRNNQQLRPTRMELGVAKFSEGSCLIQMGQTKVWCTASLEEGVPKFKKDSGEGWVTAEYGMLPRSTHERMTREASKGKIGGRTAEIQRLIGRSLRAVIDFKALGEQTLSIDCDVLQADGGTRTAAITGAFVALAQACAWGLRKKRFSQWPLKGQVAAVSVGMVEGAPRLDLEYVEDSQAEVDMNVVMTAKGKYVEIQGTAEQHPFSESELRQLQTLAAKGIRELMVLQCKVLKKSGIVL